MTAFYIINPYLSISKNKQMKNLLVIIVLLVSTLVSGQTLNAFDADGKRHGIWKKYFEGTTVLRYQGEFNHGKEIGVFKFYHKNAKGNHPSCVKSFQNNSNVALVQYYTSTGTLLSEGKMKGKHRIGEWHSYERKTGVLIETEPYINGQLHGTKIAYYKDGKILQTQAFEKGLAHGKKIMYAPNKTIVSEYTFAYGKSHGYFVEYDSNGKKTITGKYSSNKPQGVWHYYKDGKLVSTKDYTLSANPKNIKK